MYERAMTCREALNLLPLFFDGGRRCWRMKAAT